MSCVELKDTLIGKSAVVIGGGPTTIEDLKVVPHDAFKIAVNRHCVGLLEPDLAVGMDAASHNEASPVYMDYKCKKVGIAFPTIGAWGDYHFDIEEPHKCCFTQSAFRAATLADYMGAHRIYLVGIDCKTGDTPYWHGGEHRKDTTVDNCVRYWKACLLNINSNVIITTKKLRELIGE